VSGGSGRLGPALGGVTGVSHHRRVNADTHDLPSDAPPPLATAPDTPLRLLLVDDEALARLRLRTLLQDCPGVQVAGEAADADAALAAVHAAAQAQAQGQGPGLDALLLDIRMPGRDGLRLAAALKALPRPPAVIFVTAHGEHAVKAFELEALDYLTKPVRRDRLHAALQRLRQRVRPAQAPPPSAAGPALVVTDRGRVLRVPLDEVLYLKAEQKYVTLRTAAHTHVLDESLTELEQRIAQLAPLAGPAAPVFIRVHRNALVGRHAVRALAQREAAGRDEDEPGDAPAATGEGWAVQVAPLNEWLAVSRRQVAAVRAALAADTPR
jgi:two-component system response regulator AlgR